MKRRVPKTLKITVLGVVAIYIIAVTVLTLISPRLIPIEEEDDDFLECEDDELEAEI